MPRISNLEKKIAWIVSIALGVTIVVTALITLRGHPLFDEYLLLAVVITFFPPAVLDYVEYRWKRSIDKHLPDLFRTIVQAQKAGMPLPQALEEASNRRFGPLAKELKRMVTQMSWGVSFEEALKSFCKRVETSLVKQTGILILAASHAGGKVERVFDPLEKFVQTTLTFDRERKAQTRPYIAVIYVAFSVFLFTIVMLFKSLFIQMSDVSSPAFPAMMTQSEAKRVFFHMTGIQAFFGGLIAGKMGDGSIGAGLKHSLILLSFGYLVFKVVL